MKEQDEDLAIRGGKPVRTTPLPYGKQWVDDDDVAAVADALRSDWLTTGPKVAEFENAFAEQAGTREAVSVSNGTAALHAAMYAARIGRGDEVIVPAITFAATANAVMYQGGRPVFADVDPDTLLIDPGSVSSRITKKTRAILAVDFAGQPCDYSALCAIADDNNLLLIDDACHALGATCRGRNVGSLASLNTFSFHPVKHITTAEGGMITTDDAGMAARMRTFRNHGITTDSRERERKGSWYYEMTDLGFNYRLSDIQCALGISQLKKLRSWVKRRQEIAAGYTQAFSALPELSPLAVRGDVTHAFHLYVVRLNPGRLTTDRAGIFSALRAEGINVNVHYIPVHLHPYYRSTLRTSEGLCPVAEDAYNRILSLPIFPKMDAGDEKSVITAVTKVVRAFS